MITKINGLMTQKTNPVKLLQNKNNSVQRAFLASKPDTFESTKEPNFTGKEKRVGELANSLITKRKNADAMLSQYMEKHLPDDNVDRAIVAVITLGLTEGIAFVRAKLEIKDEKRKIYEEFASDSQRINNSVDRTINSSDNKAEEIKANLENELKIFAQLEDVRENKIENILLQPLRYKTTPPNSVMFVSKNNNVSEELIAWTKLRADANIVTINHNDDILANMEQAEEHYQKTGEHTLLHVKDFDKLITPYGYWSDISGMKSLLGKCATKYHTTVLFSSTEPEKLDKIATADHRVSRIDIPAEKSIGEIWSTIAKQQIDAGEKLSDYEKARNALFITGYYKDGLAVTPDSTVEEIQEVWKQIDAKLIEEYTPNLVGKQPKREVVSGFVYVKDDNGKIEKHPAYMHKVLSHPVHGGPDIPSVPVSTISFDEAPNIIQQRMYAPYPFIDKANVLVDDRRHSYWTDVWRTEELDFSSNDYFFNILKDSYKKTGNDMLDKIFLNPEVSPMSPRSLVEFHYIKDRALGSYDHPKEYAPLSFDFSSDLLYPHYQGRREKYYKPNSMHCFASLHSDEKLKYLSKLKGIEPVYKFPSEEKMNEIKKLKSSIIFSDKELSERELAQKFALERLKDTERNYEKPIEALRDLLLFTGFDSQISLGENPSDDKITAALRLVRDSMIQLAKQDMRNIDYRKVFQHSYEGTFEPARGIAGLIAIADEHLAKEDNVPMVTITGMNARGAGESSHHLNPSGICRLALMLEHYEELQTCTDAMDAILRGETWFYTNTNRYIN